MYGLKWPFLLIFISYVDPVWSVYNVGTGCILGRAPRTKETLPDFH